MSDEKTFDDRGVPLVGSMDPTLAALMTQLEAYDVPGDPDSQYMYAFRVITALASRLPPMVTIQALLMGACFFADNHKVGRHRLVEIFTRFRPPAGATLRFKP